MLTFVEMILFLTVIIGHKSLLKASSDAIPLLVLKAPQSGSSWFTSILNHYSGVYICEEIFRTNQDHNSSKSFNYLVDSLKHPMKSFPRGPDKILGKKTWSIVGASYNPLLAFWVNLSGLSEKVPDLRLIVYLRTNKVKQAIATVRSKELWRKCGSLVINGNSCNLPEKSNIRAEYFGKSLISKLAIDQYIFDSAKALHLKNKNVHYVQYEELMNDSQNYDKLLLELGLRKEEVVWLSSAVTGRCRDNCSKNTSDDLRTVIGNYEEIETWIQEKYPCLLPEFYETRADVIQPSLHELCGNFFSDKVRSLITRYKVGRHDSILM